MINAPSPRNFRKFQGPHMPLSITRRFAFLFDARNETRYPPRRQQSSLIIKPWRRVTVHVSQSSFLRLIGHRIRITNDEEEDTRSFVSDLLYQVPNGDERRRATALTSCGSWLWRQILSPVANIDFWLSRFLEQARRSRDAGVDVDAAWRNQPPSAGWTIVWIFRDCRVSPACESREDNYTMM